LRKYSSSSFLPRNPSAFQQAGRWALHRSGLLGRAAIFDDKQNNGLQGSPRATCTCGEGGDGREEPTSQLHTCLEGKDRRSEISSSGEVELWLGTTRLGAVDLPAAVLTLTVAFFLDFPAAGLEAAEGFG